MNKSKKYYLIPEGQNEHVGFFLDGYYYGHPFGDDVKQGEVDEDGNFFSYLTLNSSQSKLPVAKIDGKKFTRLSDLKEFSLVSEL